MPSDTKTETLRKQVRTLRRALDALVGSLCQSCLLDGEINGATGKLFQDTCGHVKAARTVLKHSEKWGT